MENQICYNVTALEIVYKLMENVYNSFEVAFRSRLM